MCACVSCAWSAGVRACYDEGKRVAETLFFDFHRQHKIEVRVARIFNTFGPGMHPYGEKRREEREKVYSLLVAYDDHDSSFKARSSVHPLYLGTTF